MVGWAIIWESVLACYAERIIVFLERMFFSSFFFPFSPPITILDQTSHFCIYLFSSRVGVYFLARGVTREGRRSSYTTYFYYHHHYYISIAVILLQFFLVFLSFYIHTAIPRVEWSGRGEKEGGEEEKNGNES